MLNPVDATIHEILETLKADPGLSHLAFHKGWPAVSDFELPAIALSAQRASFEKQKYTTYRTEDVDENTVAVWFEQARQPIPMVLDFWTKSKTERAELEQIIWPHFFPSAEDNSVEEPPAPGMVLTLSEHHDAKIVVDLLDEQHRDSGGAKDGYFRTAYSLQTECPLLTKVIYTKADFIAGNIEVGTEVQIDN